MIMHTPLNTLFMFIFLCCEISMCKIIRGYTQLRKIEMVEFFKANNFLHEKFPNLR